MKKIIIYISIRVSNCASLGAQSRELTATANLSKGGDSIYYDFITATVPKVLVFRNNYGISPIPDILDKRKRCSLLETIATASR